MERDVTSCRMGESLESAANLFWSKDIGALPVVDATDSVVGMLTDRDVCLSGFFRGRMLKEIAIGEAMSETVTSCRASDSIEQAAQRMAEARVRRLPVLDKEGRLEGMVGWTDLVRAATKTKLTLKAAKLVLDALGAIATPHGTELKVAAPTELVPHPKEKAEKAPAKGGVPPVVVETPKRATSKKVVRKAAVKSTSKPSVGKSAAPAKAPKTTRAKPGKSARKN